MNLANLYILFILFISVSFNLILSVVNGAPVFPSEVINALTKSKSLIGGILTQQQIVEVEKSPKGFILTCHSRVIEGSDPGKVCDSAFNYLYDKCQS